MKNRNTDLIGEPRRCTCNKLLMTTKGNAVIVKCGRCKRYLVVETDGIRSVDVYDFDAPGVADLLNDPTRGGANCSR